MFDGSPHTRTPVVDPEVERMFQAVRLQAGSPKLAEEIEGMFSPLGHNQLPSTYSRGDTYFRWYTGSEVLVPLLMRVALIRWDDRRYLHIKAVRASASDRRAIQGTLATEVVLHKIGFQRINWQLWINREA